MRILHVTKKYPNALGGDAIVVENLEKQQVKNGNEVFILTTNCEDIIEKKNLMKFGIKDTPANLDNITLKRIFSLIGLYFKSFKIIKNTKPDVVHFHSPEMGFIMNFACKKYNVLMVNTCHGVAFADKQYPKIKRSLEKFLLIHSNFKKILTVDKTSLKNFKDEKINNVVYIPNGVNLNDLADKIDTLKSKKIKFIFVGRLENQKGLNYLIDAVKKIIKTHKNFKISLIGDGSKKEELKAQINRMKLNNYFEFLGRKTNEEVLKNYIENDVFILPSIWEGLPITTLEALSSNLAIITTNVGGISEVCTNNKDALIIKPKNSDAIKTAMIKLIEDKELRKRLGENGRRLIEEKYNWTKINKQIEKIYGEVIK